MLHVLHYWHLQGNTQQKVPNYFPSHCKMKCWGLYSHQKELSAATDVPTSQETASVSRYIETLVRGSMCNCPFSWGAAITTHWLLKTLLQFLGFFPKIGFLTLENVWFQLIKSFCNTWSFKIHPSLRFQLCIFFFLRGCWQCSYDGTWLKHLQNSETRLN